MTIHYRGVCVCVCVCVHHVYQCSTARCITVQYGDQIQRADVAAGGDGCNALEAADGVKAKMEWAAVHSLWWGGGG